MILLLAVYTRFVLTFVYSWFNYFNYYYYHAHHKACLALVLMPHVFDFPLDFDLCYIFLLIVSWFSTLAKMWRNVSICERNSIKMFLDLITYFRRYMRYA